jgi:hypothetical protein
MNASAERSKGQKQEAGHCYRPIASSPGGKEGVWQEEIASLMNQAWHDMFVPTHSLLEMFLRGTSMYLTIFLLLRFVLKRQTARHPGHPAH